MKEGTIVAWIVFCGNVSLECRKYNIYLLHNICSDVVGLDGVKGEKRKEKCWKYWKTFLSHVTADLSVLN